MPTATPSQRHCQGAEEKLAEYSGRVRPSSIKCWETYAKKNDIHHQLRPYFFLMSAKRQSSLAPSCQPSLQACQALLTFTICVLFMPNAIQTDKAWAVQAVSKLPANVSICALLMKALLLRLCKFVTPEMSNNLGQYMPTKMLCNRCDTVTDVQDMLSS